MQTHNSRPALSVVRPAAQAVYQPPRIRPAGQGITPTQGAFALIAVSLAAAFGLAYAGSQLQRAH